jgi:glycosyltransferase involved in cell wall biosynthesis
LLGRLDDRTLQAYLKLADICINLRYPPTEGASASLLEQMDSAKPVIVTQAGCFAELPDTCVRKVALANEPAELRKALRELLDDPAAASALGRNARQYVAGHCTVRQYADTLREFFPQVDRWRHPLWVMDRVGRELNDMGATGDMEIADQAARQVSLMLAGR